MIGTVRKVLQEHGGLHTPVDSLLSDADLYTAGLTPFAAIKVVGQPRQHANVDASGHGKNVFLKCRRSNAVRAQPYPPDGQGRERWIKLKAVLGTEERLKMPL